MKFLRTVRFDSSDLQVFDHAADDGQWAVPGGFAFADDATFSGKRKQEFANGFLSIDSFGWSTFVCVIAFSPAEYDLLCEQLAAHLVDEYHAPSIDAARRAAVQEIDFVTGLCAPLDVGTVLTVQRDLDDTGEIREAFRTVSMPANCAEAPVWRIVEDTE